MGKPSPLLNVKLLDDDGREVDDGEEGAICVTGLKEAYPPGLFVGYYGNPERTVEAVGGEYYNLHDIYRHKTPEAADELDEIYTAAPIAFPGTVLRHSDNIDRLLQADVQFHFSGIPL